MKRLAPALRGVGIHVEDYREPTVERRRMWKLSNNSDKKNGRKEASEPSELSEEDKNPGKNEENSSDGFRTASEGLGHLFDDAGQLLNGSARGSRPKEIPSDETNLNELDGSDGRSHLRDEGMVTS
jgi:hypothetical protein